MQKIIDLISKVENGFKPIEFEAKKIAASVSVPEVKIITLDLLKHKNYQVRSLAVFLLGYIAPEDDLAMRLLRTQVGTDKSWQVHEIVAKSFDFYCNECGYENSLPVINDWLNDKNANVNRAVTEGLRIWTSRPFFKNFPEIAINLISQHKANESEYLRKSVGNSLRDISKKHKELVDEELLSWDTSDKKINFTYKLVVKNRK